jgi:hypothetical protein
MLGILHRAVAEAAPDEEIERNVECSEQLVQQIDQYFGRASAGEQSIGASTGASTGAPIGVPSLATQATSGKGLGARDHGHRTMTDADKRYLRGDVRVLLKQDGLCSAGLQITARVLTRWVQDCYRRQCILVNIFFAGSSMALAALDFLPRTGVRLPRGGVTPALNSLSYKMRCRAVFEMC